MKNPITTEHRACTESRLSELSQANITNLTQFAEHRLAANGLNPSGGEDVVQRALMLILQGLESDGGGRVPRPVDVENNSSFLNYIRGAISSISEAMGRKREFRSEHYPWNDAVGEANATLRLPGTERAELNDLRDQLFPRLRARAPQRLRKTIDAWEAVFTESDRIPAPGHRRYISEVKQLAQQIMLELGGIR